MNHKRSLEDTDEDDDRSNNPFHEAELAARATQELYNTVRNLCRVNDSYLTNDEDFKEQFEVQTAIQKNPLLPTKLGVNQPRSEWKPEPMMVEVYLQLRNKKSEHPVFYTLFEGYNMKYPFLLTEERASTVDASGIFGSRQMSQLKEAWPADVYKSQTTRWLQQMREEGWCLDPDVFIDHPVKGKRRAIDCIADYFVPKN
jgi:hypothetical protein